MGDVHPRPTDGPREGKVLDPLSGLGPVSANVLIIGRSVGEREGVARAVHRHQRGEDGVFLKLPCGPEEQLLAQALQGWLTWAEGEEPPRLLARLQGGSLFLDEIETLGSATQKLLLEFLKLERLESERGSAAVAPRPCWKGQLIAGSTIPLRLAIRDRGFLPELADCLDKVRVVLDPEEPGPRP